MTLIKFKPPRKVVEEEQKRIDAFEQGEGREESRVRAVSTEAQVEDLKNREEYDDDNDQDEQKQEQQQQQEEEEQGVVEADGSGRASDRTTCFLCRKTFPSRKSLYGHMRCHPDRDWRGTAPPGSSLSKNFDNSNNSPPLPGPAVSSLWSWSTTQKRGRKGTKHHSPVRSACFLDEDPMITAVCSLLHIAEGGYNHDRVELQMPTDESIEEGGVVSDDEFSSNPSDVELEPEIMKSCEDLEQLGAANDDINGDSEEQEHGTSEKKGKRKRKRKEQETLQEHRPTRRSRYRCTTCNKYFATHQALGGHRASHKKEKIAQEEESAGDDAEAAAPPPSTEQSPATTYVVVPRALAFAEHPCDKCDMVFPTGQALGGHKRKHWNGHESSAAAAAAAAAATPPKENSQPLLLPGSGSSSSESPKEITTQRCGPGDGDPGAGTSTEVCVRQRFPEVGASAAPMFEEIAQTRRGSNPESTADASAEGNAKRQRSGANQDATASATKGRAEMASGTLHDFDLNEKPKDGPGEEGF